MLHSNLLKKAPDVLSTKRAASGRVFKTAWFAKAARQAKITDIELCIAARQIMQGQADNLGGGVHKKRLNDNMHRSIVLAKAGQNWIYAYLYAKKDRENIARDELVAFRKLARDFAAANDAGVTALLRDEELSEICHDC